MTRSEPFDLRANRLTLLRLAVFSAAIGFAAYPLPVTAAPVLFDTFGPNDSYNIDSRYGVDGNAEFQAFRFVPNESAAVGEITVALGRTAVTTSETQFNLYDGTAVGLGNLLESFNVSNTVVPGLSPGEVVTFSSLNQPFLTAGQNYWLNFTEPNVSDGSRSLWFFNDQGIFGTRLTGVLPAQDHTLPAFRVEAVPEPTTTWLLLAGLLAILWRGRPIGSPGNGKSKAC